MKVMAVGARLTLKWRCFSWLPRKESKRMPLTTPGIAIQILASIRAYRTHRELCSTNDCKVIVNILVRKFSEPLQRRKQQKSLMSRRVAAGEKSTGDHAVPVDVLVEQMLKLEDGQLEISDINIRNLEGFLTESLLLVAITPDENRRLCGHGLRSCMPKGWSEPGNPLYGDPLARFREAGIEIETPGPSLAPRAHPVAEMA
jgi:hypothetical protein